MINIFEYQNYRLYLRDYYNDQKASKKYFSYRYFSKKAGINASAFLYYVIENKRNLTKNSILKISRAIGHNREEALYFENLVFFNQSDTIAEKTKYYNEIIEARKPIDINSIEKDRYEYFSEWYHCIVREAVTFLDFQNDYKKLGSFLVPQISETQAASSVRLLEKLGFIEKDDTGLYHQTDRLISAKPESQDAFIIEKFQTEMLELAQKAYDLWPRADRMSSSTTLSISRQTFELLKHKTREFRREILEIARLDDSMDQVFQLTMNLFPLSSSTYVKKD
jgi:uncharacterized protein (TIGR02147 family)